MPSLLEALVRAVDKAATQVELDTGRGKVTREKIEERIGISKGMRQAIEIMKTTAKAVNTEED